MSRLPRGSAPGTRLAEGCELAGRLGVVNSDKGGRDSVAARSKPSAGSAEIEKQRGAVVDALDRLFAHEIPAGDRHRVCLRLVWPEGEAIDRDRSAKGCAPSSSAATIGGHLELFAAVYAVMVARPERRMWNWTMWRRCGVTLASTGLVVGEIIPANRAANGPWDGRFVVGRCSHRPGGRGWPSWGFLEALHGASARVRGV